ncbi:MAG: sigma-70 family RNA polymerase sigma factor [Acidimicrobiales bacterium]
MGDQDWLAGQFEDHRAHLRAVSYRMLGSYAEAEDAVQDTWLRVSRSGVAGVENLGGWLTTVVARVCLNYLRARNVKREDVLDDEAPLTNRDFSPGPEDEAVLADSVGLALLVVLDTLSPAERLAFVLHDMFGVPFDELAPIVGRSPEATRQLASRARRRVQGQPVKSSTELAAQRSIVDAFLAASRNGDFESLLQVLDPGIVFRVDPSLVSLGAPTEIRGAQTVASNALAYASRTSVARLALVNGEVGMILAPGGKLRIAGVFDFDLDRHVIVAVDLIADPRRLHALDVALLSD